MTIPLALDKQIHDENEEISLKHGSVPISTLRSIYGPTFASGFEDADTLDTVLTAAPDHVSLAQLRADYYKGDLADKLAP